MRHAALSLLIPFAILFLGLVATKVYTPHQYSNRKVVSHHSKKSDREAEGFRGAVQSVRVEQSGFSKASGEWAEGPRELSETLTYDAGGNLSEWNRYIPNSPRYRETDFQYDDNNNLITVTEFNCTGRTTDLFWKRVYLFDEQQREVEEDSYNSEGQIDSKLLSTYDADGRVMERAYCHPDGSLISKVIYTYDAKGRIETSSEYKADGTFEHRWEYHRDEEGNLLQQDFFDGEGSILGRDTYEYVEFDSQGSWVKRIERGWMRYFSTPELTPTCVTYRILTYY